MTKTEAINLLGGTSAALARAVGITPASVSEWPEELPPRLADRVQAALWRKANESHDDAAQAATDTDDMKAMLERQRDRALARLAQDPTDSMAQILVTNREQALADIAENVAKAVA